MIFNLNEDQLENMFLLQHTVCSEAYIKAFQYKVLNFILYTNNKLYKIGYITDDKCSFCKSEPETLLHFFSTVHTQSFSGKIFESYFYSLSKEFVHLSLQDNSRHYSVRMPLTQLFLIDIYGIAEDLKYFQA